MAEKKLLLGDEAIALGAIHAGISGVYAYPGTPSTEITEFIQNNPLAKERKLHSTWCTNEKTAMEAALGMSYAGKRALVCMKHVGMNVVFNCDMVLYYIRQYMDSGHSPERMVDPNTKTDYNKLKKLLQLDRLDGDRRGVIRRIVEEGQIITEVEESFPAKDLTNPNIFPSLLFYYGMLTIKGTYGSQLILCIPNNNVRKQYYEYLLEGYNEYSGIRISSLLTLFTRMSFDGQWREALQYTADAYKNLSSVRDSIEGERSIQGFFMAYLSLNDYYITAPELELSHGYCDFFLLPNLTHYQSKHSYIVELKYLPKKDFEAKAAEQWQQAVEQIDSYARAPRVEALRQGTQMHKIVMQFSGWDLMRMEEV